VSAETTCVLADGEHRYAVDTAWAKLPDGSVLGDVAAVGIGADGRVFAFSRGEHPMAIFDRDGTFLGSWGQDVFTRAHGLHVAPDGFLYCTDDGDHTVRKCTPDGEVVMTLGIPGEPAPHFSDKPFCRCTHTALSPDGDIYVSDGYGNSAVHCFSPEGELKFSWGGPGTEPGEFHLPHNICCDADGWVYVADRENSRIQVFDGQGRFETQFHGVNRPCALALSPGDDPELFVGELGPLFNNFTPWIPNVGARISVLDRSGERRARLGSGRMGRGPDELIAPHGLAVDVNGDVYLGEVAGIAWPMYFEGPPPVDLTTVRKLTRIS